MNLIQRLKQLQESFYRLDDSDIAYEFTQMVPQLLDRLEALELVAAEMRSSLKIRVFDEDIDLQEPWIEVHIQDEDAAIASAQSFDALMKKEMK